MADTLYFPTTADEWITFTIPAHTIHRDKASATFQDYLPTNPPTPFPTSAAASFANNPDFWGRISPRGRAGIILAIIGALLVIAGLTMCLCCCGCCGGRKKSKNQAPNDAGNYPRPQNSTPLQTIQGRSQVPGHMPLGEAPPPTYEEAVPLQHQQFAGGISHERDEEDGVISDGKQPLSEIPFEDIILDHSSTASSSSRTFEQRHHGLGGDTRGHTNT